MSINLDQLRSKLEALETKGTGGSSDFLNNFLSLEDGDNLIRILPSPEDSGKEFYAETMIHRIPTEDGKTKNFHCLKVHGKSCPVCEAYYGLWKAYNATGKTDETLSAAARQIKPRERYYMNVVDRGSKQVKILSIGQIIYKKIIKVMTQKDPETGEYEYGDITNLTEGHDYIINKVMEDGWPKYGDSMVRPRQTAAGSQKEIDGWMGTLHDIYALVKEEDYEEAKNIALSIYPQLELDRPVAKSPTKVSSGDSFEDSIQS